MKLKGVMEMVGVSERTGGGGHWPKSEDKLKSKLRCILKKDIYFHTPTSNQITEASVFV
jgi:hypothetical protein